MCLPGAFCFLGIEDQRQKQYAGSIFFCCISLPSLIKCVILPRGPLLVLMCIFICAFFFMTKILGTKMNSGNHERVDVGSRKADNVHVQVTNIRLTKDNYLR